MSDLQCAASLVLARHAEAEYETEHWSDAGGSLTTRGREQARALGEALRDRRIAHVWSSTMARAVQTAEIAASVLGVAVTTRDGLQEFAVGDLAGQPLPGDPFAPWFGAWVAGDLTSRVPGGESGEEVRARFAGVLEEIADQSRGETVLVVGHGGVLRAMVPALCRMAARPDRLHNCARIEVAIDGDGLVCRDWEPYRAG